MKACIIKFGFAACLLLQLAAPTMAVEPQEMLRDPALEARARAISVNLRCLVCQNQSIDDSNAGLARDLRLIVRERLQLGESDAQIEEFIVNRFGHYVLLSPPLQPNTIFLWWGPALVFASALSVFLVYTLRRSATAPAATEPLTPEETRMLEQFRSKNT
jgi:cytochrome c-type biogenesis protein CcmH